jgi:ubiquitin-conjugating enzyme E2 M
MNKGYQLRITNELRDLERADLYVSSKLFFEYEEDKMEIRFTLIAPENSIYNGGTFEFLIRLPSDFPFFQPRVECLTPIYHPILKYGVICSCCMNMSDWKPSHRIINLVEQIYKLFGDWNPNNYYCAPTEHKESYNVSKEKYENHIRYIMGKYQY